jgi:hypothetical protein
MPRRLSPQHFVLTRRPAISAGRISAPRTVRFSNFSERARRERKSEVVIRTPVAEFESYSMGVRANRTVSNLKSPSQRGERSRARKRERRPIYRRRANTSPSDHLRRSWPPDGTVTPGVFYALLLTRCESIQVAPVRQSEVSMFPSTSAGIRFSRPNCAVQKICFAAFRSSAARILPAWDASSSPSCSCWPAVRGTS